MASGTPMPAVKRQFFDDNGAPAAGYLLYTYAAGTATPLATYSDALLLTLNTNPIELDAAGRAIIYLLPKTYKFVLKTPAGATVWTQDNVPATSISLATYPEVFHFGGSRDDVFNHAAYESGATLDKLLFGTSILAVDTAVLPGTYVLEAMVEANDALAVVTVALVNLTDGAPDTPLVGGTLNSSGDTTTPQRRRSGTITLPGAGATKQLGIKAKVNNAAYYGAAWGVRLVRT